MQLCLQTKCINFMHATLFIFVHWLFYAMDFKSLFSLGIVLSSAEEDDFDNVIGHRHHRNSELQR